MTTRADLIYKLRHETWSGFQSMAEQAADMLEADELMRLANVDCTLHFDTLMEDHRKLKAAAQLGLDAFDKMVGRKPEFVEQAIAALRQALK